MTKQRASWCSQARTVPTAQVSHGCVQSLPVRSRYECESCAIASIRSIQAPSARPEPHRRETRRRSSPTRDMARLPRRDHTRCDSTRGVFSGCEHASLRGRQHLRPPGLRRCRLMGSRAGQTLPRTSPRELGRAPAGRWPALSHRRVPVVWYPLPGRACRSQVSSAVKVTLSPECPGQLCCSIAD